ncbi:MAG: ribonuclease P protein component [Buchnera aphidicola (Nurudea shiraii)]
MKLLTTTHFKYVFNKPKKIKFQELIILTRDNKLQFPRLGISISRKDIKHSCRRNKTKRIIREVFRLIQYKLICADFVVIVKLYFKNTNNICLKEKLENLWSYYYR